MSVYGSNYSAGLGGNFYAFSPIPSFAIGIQGAYQTSYSNSFGGYTTDLRWTCSTRSNSWHLCFIVWYTCHQCRVASTEPKSTHKRVVDAKRMRRFGLCWLSVESQQSCLAFVLAHYNTV